MGRLSRNSKKLKSQKMCVGQFRLKFKRIPQRIPLPWADDPAAKRLLERNEWLTGQKGRLPRHYVAFHKQWEKQPKAFIHDIAPCAKFEKDEFGNVQRVQMPRIPILYPEEFHEGLWGGEGIVKGGLEPEMKKHAGQMRNKKFQPQYKAAEEKYWVPKLHFGVVYSEILDKYLEIAMTERAERLIDEAFGLDNYLLKTEVNEIYSHMGLKLKRELLLTLANAEVELYPNEPTKRNEMLDKYKDFIWPFEEADWHGLPLAEALHKAHSIDRIEEELSIRPKKEEYREFVLEKLANNETDDLDDLYAVVNPYENESDPGLISSTYKKIEKNWNATVGKK